ncbi:MAG: hypothetical protein IJ570_02565 [Prevotella sp.]|nr:hypothetical protein [Prevotella sp.]
MVFDEKYAKGLISKVSWIWAKTYPSIPHEYIVRNKCGLSDTEFLYLVNAQREFGIHEQWHKYNFPYLYIDGYKYWTMGDAIDETIILNRQKVFSEFDNLDSQAELSPELYKNVFRIFNEAFADYDIYEAGCGRGESVKWISAPFYKYRGVDPSKKAIGCFKNSNPNYSNRIFDMSFEESVNYWSKGELVLLATFGSASYFMSQYLKILAQSEIDYFLMFYKEDYCPAEYISMHHFDYTDENLQTLFPKAFHFEIDNYRVLSSKELAV